MATAWATDVAPWAPLDTMDYRELVIILGWAANGIEFAAQDREEGLWRRDGAKGAHGRTALRYWRQVHREALSAVAQRFYRAGTS